ncbi:MAG: sigma factor-like helix-turn-helix DNA-binding protein [Planctomycetota bacterium]
MDEAFARRPETSRPEGSGEAALADLKRLDPGGTVPGPWLSDEEIGERLLPLLEKDPEGVLRHLVRLLRPAVEAAVRDVLDREEFVLDVAEVSLRVFVRLRAGERGRGESLRARLRSVASEAVREYLYPDPLETPLLPPDGPGDPKVTRAALAAFNRLARSERIALRAASLDGRPIGEIADRLGVVESEARAILRRARRRFVEERRRLLADAARRARSAPADSEREEKR